jgi:hypothetical protein
VFLEIGLDFLWLILHARINIPPPEPSKLKSRNA